MAEDVPIPDLARILIYASQGDRIKCQDLASEHGGGVDEALLALWGWKLVIPVRSSRCSEWDSRIFSTGQGELYEMPNISKTLVKKGIETGNETLKKMNLSLT